ncbi:MAG: amphi-Trp domain-containing protein [Planctomycetota bacterium]
MELLEHEEKRRMSREEAAAVLRDLADQLARHNELAFTRGGIQYRVDVADEVDIEVEIEIGEESQLEIEISW